MSTIRYILVSVIEDTSKVKKKNKDISLGCIAGACRHKPKSIEQYTLLELKKGWGYHR